MIKVSYGALKLLKFVLSFTGEKEVNDKGVEINSTRKMNAIDSSQRRHFMTAMTNIERPIEDRIKAESEAFQEKLEVAKKEWKDKHLTNEGESGHAYESRMLADLDKDVALTSEVKKINDAIANDYTSTHELPITDKTLDVVKKYFSEYGETSGFMPGDDENVSELLSVFGLE